MTHDIAIPDDVEYTKPLICQVDPPCEDMTITFTLVGEDKPFREGKIEGRRCPEIASYMFRPRKLDKTTKQFPEPLKAGDKIIVKIICKDKDGKETEETKEVAVT